MTLPDRELDDLVGQLLEGQLSPAAAARLAELIGASDAAAARYAQQVALHALLEAELHPQLPDVELSRPAANHRGRWRAALAKSARYFARPTPLSLAVSALVMLVAVGMMALLAPPFYERLTQPPREIIYVAQLDRLHQPRWAEGQGGTQRGARLWIGHRLRLEQGLAELAFDSGSRLLLEGPADLTLTGANSVHLHAGRATAAVPPAAVGFRVETPSVVATDLGTAFGALVRGSSTEIDVFEGSVEVAPVGRSPASKLVLHANQAVRVDAHEPIEFVAAGSRAVFTRRLPDPDFWMAADFGAGQYRAGTLRGQQGWRATSDNATLEVADDGEGHLLRFQGAADNGASRPIVPIGAAAQATLVAQFRPVGSGPYDLSIGLCDRAAPGSFDDYVAQVVVLPNGSNFRLQARNFGQFQALATNLPTDAWYRVWLVVDNARDTYDVYLAGGPLTEPKLIGQQLKFRHAVPGEITSIYLRVGGAGNITPVQLRSLHVFAGDELWTPADSQPPPAPLTPEQAP